MLDLSRHVFCSWYLHKSPNKRKMVLCQLKLHLRFLAPRNAGRVVRVHAKS